MIRSQAKRSPRRRASVLWLAMLVAVGVALETLGAASALAHGRFQFTKAKYTTTQDFGVAYVTVQRGLGADGRAAVYVSTVQGAGNAVVGRDFTPLFNVSLVWQDGEDMEKELYVPVLNDGEPQEEPKSFVLRLHDALGAEINADRNVTEIVLAPPSNLVPGSFRFETAALSVMENSSLVVPVRWEGGTTSHASVHFEIDCGSACAPDDFSLDAPTSQLLEWTRDDYASATNRTQTIELRVLADDLYEPAESFTLRLVPLEPTEDDLVGVGAVGSIGELVVTIAGPNDVQAGSLQFEADCFPDCVSRKYTVVAGGAALVVLQRRDGSDGAASVTIATADDTALAGLDYEALELEVSWAEGDTSDRHVLIQSLLREDPRLPTRRVALVLRDNAGAVLSGEHASLSYVDISSPTGVYPGEVNFAAPEPLDAVLRYPDRSFVELASRYASSRLQLCPRLEANGAGVLSVALQRNFGAFPTPASAVVNTLPGTATAGVDFEPLEDVVVQWEGTDIGVKHVNLTLLTPSNYVAQPLSLWLQLSDVTGAALGDCNTVEVVVVNAAQGPHVTAFDLDMQAGTLTLELSHGVLATTLDVTKLQLQSEEALGNGPIFGFSQQHTTTSSADGATLVLNIGDEDLNALKRVPQLTKLAEKTFLSVESGLFRYILDNCQASRLDVCTTGELEPTPASAALAVRAFVADTTPPTLVGFSLDLPRRLLKLHFSEPVDFTTLNVEALSLSETAAGFDLYPLSSTTTTIFAPQPDPLSGAMLGDSNRLPADQTFLTLQLGTSDITALHSFGGGRIGVSIDTTFLAIDSSFVADFAQPPNRITGIVFPDDLLQVSPVDCSSCPSGSVMSSSCSDLQARQCRPCTVCESESFALQACTPTQDTTCYPCTECRAGEYISVSCSATTNRVCSPCRQCTLDEYEVSPCAAGKNRECRTCNSCTLSRAQQRMCQRSPLWKRLQMKTPYSCPLSSQRFQTREEALQLAQSNRCGSGRCLCSDSGVGNSNPNGDSFPQDWRCARYEVYDILL